MTSVKILLVVVFVAAFASTISAAGLLNALVPKVIGQYYKLVPTKEGYNFTSEEPNGSKREERGIILNPGTKEQELVVMGTYSSVDEKRGIAQITMYTADKNGYRARYEIKNRKLNPSALKSAAG